MFATASAYAGFHTRPTAPAQDDVDRDGHQHRRQGARPGSDGRRRRTAADAFALSARRGDRPGARHRLGGLDDTLGRVPADHLVSGLIVATDASGSVRARP